MIHPGDIRAFDQVLVDHLLELGFQHCVPAEIVTPANVVVLTPTQLQGGADIWWWHGPRPPANPNERQDWQDRYPVQGDGVSYWTNWVFRQRVIHHYMWEPLIWHILQKEMDWQMKMFVHTISDWHS